MNRFLRIINKVRRFFDINLHPDWEVVWVSGVPVKKSVEEVISRKLKLPKSTTEMSWGDLSRLCPWPHTSEAAWTGDHWTHSYSCRGGCQGSGLKEGTTKSFKDLNRLRVEAGDLPLISLQPVTCLGLKKALRLNELEDDDDGPDEEVK